MNYFLYGGPVALRDLAVLFQRACEAHSCYILETTATMILIKLLEDAKARGLLEEVPEASEGCEEASDGSQD